MDDNMSDATVRIVNDNTERIKELMRDAVRVALEVVGLQAKGYAKRYCPVDTRRLRNSIAHTTDDTMVC